MYTCYGLAQFLCSYAVQCHGPGRCLPQWAGHPISTKVNRTVSYRSIHKLALSRNIHWCSLSRWFCILACKQTNQSVDQSQHLIFSGYSSSLAVCQVYDDLSLYLQTTAVQLHYISFKSLWLWTNEDLSKISILCFGFYCRFYDLREVIRQYCSGKRCFLQY